MGFKEGDVVRVVKAVGDTDTCHWATVMDAYVGDGKEHVVINDTDRDGDTLVKMADGDSYYFPPGSLELTTTRQNGVDALFNKISAAYNYNGLNFNTVSGLRRELVQEAYRRFVGCANNTVGIEALIDELETVKEVCLKLK